MDGSPEDHSLAMAAAGGDRRAFAVLVERHYARIYRLGWRLLGSREAGEDLAQEVCAGLGRRIASFRGEAAFGTWLYRIALNAARDQMRRRARAGRLEERWSETEALERAGSEARAAELAWLRVALATLSPDLRETAVLVLDEGLSHADAGAVLGVSGGTVSWRMSEIRKALRGLAERPEDVG